MTNPNKSASGFLLAATLSAALLGGCATVPESPEAIQTCQVVVEENFAAAQFQSNPLSRPTGPLAGAGLGAVYGLQGGMGAVITVPFFAIVGGVYGAACAAYSADFPNADADFERILLAADSTRVKRGIETHLNSARLECGIPRPGAGKEDSPRVIVTINNIDAGMGCLHGRQTLFVQVRWRAVVKELAFDVASQSRRARSSPLEVKDWFAQPALAQTEIESVFDEVGGEISSFVSTRVAAELQSNLRRAAVERR